MDIKSHLVRTACVASLLLVFLPAAAQAQFRIATNNGAITITGYSGPGGAVVIPGATNGLPVTAIGNYAFVNAVSMTQVTIPDSVTNIGVGAFSCCHGLTNVTIPDGVSNIGDTAFSPCTRLDAITVHAGNSFFSGVDGILFDWSQTKLIQYPAGKVGSDYTIPSSVTNIGSSAFSYCTVLSSVTIPSSVTSIGSGAFSFCKMLSSVTIPTGVTSIGTSAFQGCGSLTNVTIPESVLSIGQQAFSECTSLTAITLPKNVTSIGNSPFSYCTSLISITVDADNSFFRSVDGVLFDKNQTTLIQYPGGKVGSYTVPSDVTGIANDAFRRCYGLSSVTIHGAAIGGDAFAACPNLTAITVDATNAFHCSVDGVLFDKSQTKLIQFPGGRGGDYALPDNVTSVWYSAFFECARLTRVTIPSSVTSIKDSAFYSCTSLMGVYFRSNPPSLDSNVFLGDNNTIYYLPRNSGWGETYGGRPTALWLPRAQTSDASFGVRTNQFGFNIAWASGQKVVVEACTNLVDPIWSALQTNTLSGDSFYFSDPDWANHPGRFYRIRSP